jgi:hypothetical protein
MKKFKVRLYCFPYTKQTYFLEALADVYFDNITKIKKFIYLKKVDTK